MFMLWRHRVCHKPARISAIKICGQVSQRVFGFSRKVSFKDDGAATIPKVEEPHRCAWRRQPWRRQPFIIFRATTSNVVRGVTEIDARNVRAETECPVTREQPALTDDRVMMGRRNLWQVTLRLLLQLRDSGSLEHPNAQNLFLANTALQPTARPSIAISVFQAYGQLLECVAKCWLKCCCSNTIDIISWRIHVREPHLKLWILKQILSWLLTAMTFGGRKKFP